MTQKEEPKINWLLSAALHYQSLTHVTRCSPCQDHPRRADSSFGEMRSTLCWQAALVRRKGLAGLVAVGEWLDGGTEADTARGDPHGWLPQAGAGQLSVPGVSIFRFRVVSAQ